MAMRAKKEIHITKPMKTTQRMIRTTTPKPPKKSGFSIRQAHYANKSRHGDYIIIKTPDTKPTILKDQGGSLDAYLAYHHHKNTTPLPQRQKAKDFITARLSTELLKTPISKRVPAPYREILKQPTLRQLLRKGITTTDIKNPEFRGYGDYIKNYKDLLRTRGLDSKDLATISKENNMKKLKKYFTTTVIFLTDEGEELGSITNHGTMTPWQLINALRKTLHGEKRWSKIAYEHPSGKSTANEAIHKELKGKLNGCTFHESEETTQGKIATMKMTTTLALP